MYELNNSKKIFLDFDGVIVDSNKFKERSIENAIFKLLGKNEETIKAVNFFNKNAGISRESKLSNFFNNEEVSKILNIYGKECNKFFSKALPVKGLREFLEDIRVKYKNINLYILSGGEKEEIILFLRKNLIFDYFEDVLASEKSKLDHLKDKDVSENDIFIGDSKNDLKTALQLDLKFILFAKYKSFESFPSKESIKDNVLLETENFKSILNVI